MQFYNIHQKVYDWYKKNLSNPLNSIREKFSENLYITDGVFNDDTEDEVQGAYRLYKGEHLLGDAYVPQAPLTSTITKDMGNIKKGTTVADLITSTQGSMSAILDRMICPNYASVYHEPYFVATSEVQSPYCYVGQNVPQATISNITTSQAINANTQYSCTGGEVTLSKRVTEGEGCVQFVSKGENVNNNYSADDVYKFVKPGVVTLEYTISCAQGPQTVQGKDNTIKDSTGNPVKYCSLKPDTLMSSTQDLTDAYSADAGGGVYVLAARKDINPVQFTYYAAYPVYSGTGSYTSDADDKKWIIKSLTKYSKEESYKAISDTRDYSTLKLPSQNHALIIIHNEYDISEIYMEAHNGTFSSYNIVNSLVMVDNVKVLDDGLVSIKPSTAGPSDVIYKVYMFNDKCLGDSARYQIKITKSNGN